MWNEGLPGWRGYQFVPQVLRVENHSHPESQLETIRLVHLGAKSITNHWVHSIWVGMGLVYAQGELNQPCIYDTCHKIIKVIGRIPRRNVNCIKYWWKSRTFPLETIFFFLHFLSQFKAGIYVPEERERERILSDNWRPFDEFLSAGFCAFPNIYYCESFIT